MREEAPAPPRLRRPQLPPELEALCLHALAKRPEDRCASAGVMGQQVQRWLGEMAERTHADVQRGRFFALSLDLMTIVGSDGYYKELNPAWDLTAGGWVTVHGVNCLKTRGYANHIARYGPLNPIEHPSTP